MLKSNKVTPFFIFLLLVSCLTPEQKLIKKSGGHLGVFAKITTEKGIIIAQLDYDKVPVTVANFVGLAQGLIPNSFKKNGEPFYDGLKFYKVFKGYMAYTGCPRNDGQGHPGYFFKDEFNKNLKHDKPGVLSMISNGPNTSGSQFIITMRPTVVLDNKNPVFGHVISGMDIVNALQQGDAILKIEIIKIGRKAEKFDPLKVFKENGFENMLKPK